MRFTMRSFFRNLKAERVDYILISGQAAVLYGAATFSEDVDLWVEPSSANFARLASALRASRARVYKLTPPLEAKWVRGGHGFHFVLPEAIGPGFLDVMGRPPRVGAFAAARRRARLLSTEWGELPVVGIPELAELKKTRRLGDYEVISKLARIEIEARPRTSTRWALENMFRVEDVVWLFGARAGAVSTARRSSRRSWRTLATRWGKRLDLASVSARVQRMLNEEIAVLQTKDVAYWSRIIDELRALRRAGGLLTEGDLL
jgi:hypothetical protein